MRIFLWTTRNYLDYGLFQRGLSNLVMHIRVENLQVVYVYAQSLVMLPIVVETKDEIYDVKKYVICSKSFGTNGIFQKATYLIKSERSIVYIEGSKIIISKRGYCISFSEKSKWVWRGNTTITQCRPAHGTARKNDITITLLQNKKEDKDQESIQSSTTPDPGYQDIIETIKEKQLAPSSLSRWWQN